MCKSNDLNNSMQTVIAAETSSEPNMQSEAAVPPLLTLKPPEESRKHPSKTVRFSEEDPVIVSNNLKPFNTKEYFWQESDYRRFLQMASLIAVEVRKLSFPRKPLDYEDVLIRTLLACQESAVHAPPDGSNSDPDVGLQALQISPHLFTALSNWTQAGSSRRGLEKLIIPVLAKCRNEKRQASLKAVLDIQRDLAHDMSNPQCQHDHQDKDTLIRRASEKFTRSAKLYALVIGHADAVAVGHHHALCDLQ